MSYLVLQKSKKGFVYAYQVTSYWNTERQYSTQTRIYIGRQDPKTGLIIPGRRRNEDIPGAEAITVDAAKKVIKDGGDLLSRFAEAAQKARDPKISASGIGVECVSEPGCAYLVSMLTEAIGLDQTLNAVFGESVAKQLLMLAAYQITEGTPLYLARPWLDRVLGEKVLKRAGFTGDGALLEQIGGDTPLRMRFFQDWLARRNHPQALVYDITSISTYSELLDLAEFGYNRDGEQLPQINLASVHDRMDGLPLFYRITPGSISDTSTLKLTSDLMEDFGLKRFHFVLDRGFCSNANMVGMIEKKIGFTMALPLTSSQAKAFVKTRRLQLGRTKNAFVWNGSPMYYIQGEWPVAMGSKKKSGICNAHLYLDPKRKTAKETRLLSRILLIEERAAATTYDRLAEAYFWLDANAHGLKRYLAVRRCADGSAVIQRKNNAISARCAHMGITLIVTTDTQLGRDETLMEYRSRDSIEKAFDIFKNENGQNRLHVSTRSQAEGRVFLAFLALIISCELDRRMRLSELYKRFTVAEVLAELAKIRRLHMSDGSMRLLEITKTQRTILEKLMLPPIPENLVII